MNDNKLLAGKTAIITGGAYGIGRAISERFQAEGAKVIIFDNNEEKLRKIASELGKLGNIFSYKVDVRDKNAIQKALTDIEEKIGTVDTLVNNAGINPHSPLEQMPDEIWQNTLDINLNGSRYMTQIIGGRMKEKQIKGSIIFITSVHTLHAFPGDSHYDASKLGMLGLMRCAAIEWARDGIRSNAVAPGAIYPTGITERLSQQDIANISERIPLGRIGDPKEIASVVAFLASNMASYVTGAEIRADGGLAVKSPIT